MERDEVGQLIYEFQFLRGVAESIQQRIGLINATISELNLAALTLEGISNEESGNVMLVPIGGGSYIRAKLEDKEKLIVGIGANVSLEKTVEEARNDFRTRILELEKVRNSLKQQFDETSTKIDGMQRQIQKIAQSTSGETGNVRGP